MTLTPAQTPIEATDLRKSFILENGQRLEVLRGINLKVHKNESVAIIGESGAGKSTLISILAGLDLPDEGSLRILGQSLMELPPGERQSFRARNTSMVFQSFHLLSNLTALENVALPLQIAQDPEWARKSEQALKAVGLRERSGQFPHQLSGGEKQRIAIARALVTRPAVLFADEPSGNLDARTGDTVTELLFQLVRENESSLVLITHSPQLAARCDRVFLLKEGSLQEQVRS